MTPPPAAAPTKAAPTPTLESLVGLAAPRINKNISVARSTVPAGTVPKELLNSVSDEVILVTSGAAALHINGDTQTAKAGEVFNIPANIVYSLECVGQNELEAYAICSPAFAPEQHHVVAR